MAEGGREGERRDVCAVCTCNSFRIVISETTGNITFPTKMLWIGSYICACILVWV